VSNTYTGKAEACRFNLIDSTVAMNMAFFVNAAILVMAAANFHSRGIEVTEIQQAHELLQGVLGSQIAPLAFAVALLAAGQSSTITGTISGQIVMEGFLNLRIRPWLRRAITRALALGPAVVVIALMGSEGVYKMLILSQVVLSLQLPFAIIPLIHFTADKGKMGLFANKAWVNGAAWLTAAVIVALNVKLVVDTLADSLEGGPVWLWLVVIAGVAAVLGMLAYITFGPLVGGRRVWDTAMTTSAQRIARRLEPMKVDHVGVALEHAAGDAQVISAALSLARRHAARITLIHVVETPGGSVFGAASDSLHSRADEAYLDELARETEDVDLAVESALLFGKPAEEIIKAVDALGLDIVVLGSHGHKGMADIIFGETISKVRHTVGIPVFIVPLTDRTVERPHTDVPAGVTPA
jgi:manganese transport protein